MVGLRRDTSEMCLSACLFLLCLPVPSFSVSISLFLPFSFSFSLSLPVSVSVTLPLCRKDHVRIQRKNAACNPRIFCHHTVCVRGVKGRPTGSETRCYRVYGRCKISPGDTTQTLPQMEHNHGFNQQIIFRRLDLGNFKDLQ